MSKCGRAKGSGSGLGGEVESIDGSQGNDDVTANRAANMLRGLAGNDVLRGGADADALEDRVGTDAASHCTGGGVNGDEHRTSPSS